MIPFIRKTSVAPTRRTSRPACLMRIGWVQKKTGKSIFYIMVLPHLLYNIGNPGFYRQLFTKLISSHFQKKASKSYIVYVPRFDRRFEGAFWGPGGRTSMYDTDNNRPSNTEVLQAGFEGQEDAPVRAVATLGLGVNGLDYYVWDRAGTSGGRSLVAHKCSRKCPPQE